MAEKRTVKIFVASSSELEMERKQCILQINQLGESHSHLVLKPVEWEYSLVHGNYPGHTTIQSAINPKLQDCQLVVFIFYSKIGPYTREEFNFATANSISLFAFFKTGFSPKKEQLTAYSELLEFKEGLNETILYQEYENLDSFERQLFTNLNLYLSQNYPLLPETPSVDVSSLIKMLGDKEEEIKRLKEKPGTDKLDINELTKEVAAIRDELQQSKEIIEKQARDKEALEEKLSSQIDDDVLKAQALEEVKKGNYPKAEEHLQSIVEASIAKIVGTYSEMANLKELQLKYVEAFNYYELALYYDPKNSSLMLEAGDMADTLAYYEKALDYYQKSAAIDIKEYGEEHPPLGVTYVRMSWVYSDKGEYDNAIEYANKALEVFSSSGEVNQESLSSVYHCLSVGYDGKKDHERAIKYELKALEIGKELYGENHLNITSSYGSLILFYNANGDYDTAIEYGSKALDIYRDSDIEEGLAIGYTYNNMGESYLQKGNFKKAIYYFEKSLHIKKKILPAGHPYIERTKKNLTSALAEKSGKQV